MELKVFYHAALMHPPQWIPIFREQIKLARHVGLPEINCCLLGQPRSRNFAKRIAHWNHVQLNVLYEGDDFSEFEYPTLKQLWMAAKASPESAYLYWHTKGVSVPHSKNKQLWRRIMQRYVVANWRQNLASLENNDLAGTHWRTSLQGFAFFEGTFWMARGDWVAKLPDPAWHRTHRQPWQWGPWSRMWAEQWIGANPNPRVYEHFAHDIKFGRRQGVALLPIDIPGFRYEDIL